MADSRPAEDAGIGFPHVLVLKASAGSGKTYALTRRFVQFLLATAGSPSGLRNILAITFSNNAAAEMRRRVLVWLKELSLGRQEKIAELSGLTGRTPDQVQQCADEMLDEILTRYEDLQVKTIDSFMTGVFRVSSVDLGLDPDFEILMDNRRLMQYSFDLYLRRVREGSAEARLFAAIVDYLGEYRAADAAYLWDPSRVILSELTGIYRKLSASGREPLVEDFSEEMARLKAGITTILAEIDALIRSSGIERNMSSAFAKSDLLRLTGEGEFSSLIGKGLSVPPVAKLKKGSDGLRPVHEQVVRLWERFGQLVSLYAECYARSFYTPYLTAYRELLGTLEMVKRRQEKVFIEDINRVLAGYISESSVPDIYFRIGETVSHYLIDEFQDTAPVQWRNLLPLVEHSLAQQGSLFVVGDTKQAIYGFREADYTIMRALETGNPFPSAVHKVDELTTNFRSREQILAFSEQVFHHMLKKNPDYAAAAGRSGLHDYEQAARRDEDMGYAEAVILSRDDNNPPERERIANVIAGLRSRGFGFGDIAILTQRNEDAVRVSGWLSSAGIDFISYSNLDIRRRRITGEIMALLGFLDSPIDDLAFASFLLGGLFSRTLAADRQDRAAAGLHDLIFRRNRTVPLYKAFQEAYPELWTRYFADLFRVSGYFPVYDLVTEIYAVFRVFSLMAETDESVLVKILEVIKEFEGAGYNSMRDFLEYAGDEESDAGAWNMDAPKSLNAVRVMTIHKAKGLGFPAVIVLLYGGRKQGLGPVLREQDGKAGLLKVTKEIVKSAPRLGGVYDEAAAADLVNRLNSLYVGFTRAEEELYVIGVRRERESYPFDLLPVEEFRSTPPLRRHAGKEEARHCCEISHSHTRVSVPPAVPHRLKVAERQRGEFIHQVISRIEFRGDGSDDDVIHLVRSIQEESGGDYPAEEIAETVCSVLNLPEMAPWFERRQQRRVLREQEFTDRGGRLFRIDRLVIDPDGITVIEFKTGGATEEPARHLEQVQTYLQIVRDIYSTEKVRGMLCYVDIRKTVTVP